MARFWDESGPRGSVLLHRRPARVRQPRPSSASGRAASATFEVMLAAVGASLAARRRRGGDRLRHRAPDAGVRGRVPGRFGRSTLSPRMIELAREHNPGLASVEWIVGDGSSLTGIEDGSADVCISHVVLQHIPDPSVSLGYIREMGRVLRPGGWALFQFSNRPWAHRRRLLPTRHARPARSALARLGAIDRRRARGGPRRRDGGRRACRGGNANTVSRWPGGAQPDLGRIVLAYRARIAPRLENRCPVRNGAPHQRGETHGVA